MEWLPTAIVIALAMGFNYTNGFHDAANAIATSVSTRALTPHIALGMAAVANLFGAFFGTEVAATIGKGIIDAPSGTEGLFLVGAALVGAIGWNMLTWWYGLPSSSPRPSRRSRRCGARRRGDRQVGRHPGQDRHPDGDLADRRHHHRLPRHGPAAVVLPPRHPGKVSRGFRYAQSGSAGAMAFGHGLQDAAKTAGVVVLALTVGGYHSGDSVPIWVLVLSAIVISLGTYAGGWRIMRTLGRKIIHLDPPQGFAAESTAASILYIAGLSFGAPISTTHTITSSIMGVGATKRLTAVRWGVAKSIVGAWIFTFPGAGLAAALAYVVTLPFH